MQLTLDDENLNRPPNRPLSEIKAELFRALAHPARVRALELLAEGERSVGDIAPLVGIELSHLSQQLAVLRRAGLVTTRKEGSTVFYAIRDDSIIELLASAKRVLITTLAETQVLLADLQTDLEQTATAQPVTAQTATAQTETARPKVKR